MKISELARRAGVSKQTIHFYLREGLLPEPRRAGRNMAFYDEAHLERIALIKRLQTERYLPLDVIKRLVGGAERAGVRGAGAKDLALIGELFALTEAPAGERGKGKGRRGAGAKGAGSRVDAGRAAVTRAELLKRSGLDEGDLAALEREGVVVARAGGVAGGAGEARFGSWDVRIATLFGEARRAAGFDAPFAASLFARYRKHLTALARDEAKAFFAQIVGAARPLEYVAGIRRAREATNRYLLVERARLIQGEIERYVAEIESAIGADREPPLWVASPSLKARGADDRAAAVSWEDDLVGLETRLREETAREPQRALWRALLGATLVRRARRGLAEAAGVAPAFERVPEGLAHLAASAGMNGGGAGGAGTAADVAAETERRLVQLVRGRVYVAMPRFFGTFEPGLAELEGIVNEAGAARVAGGAAAVATAAWQAANAAYFAGVACDRAGDWERARMLWRRAAALDVDGPLAKRARERIG